MPIGSSGPDFTVNSTTATDQLNPSITTLSDGRFVVIWESDDSGVDRDIRARVLNADGSPDTSVNGGGDFVVNTITANGQSIASVTTLSDGRFIVAWESTNGFYSDIHARIFNADGSPDTSVNGGEDLLVNKTVGYCPSSEHLAQRAWRFSGVSASIFG